MRGSVIALALAAGFLLPASAATTSIALQGEVPNLNNGSSLKQVVLKYDDVNPADKQGAATLLERLNRVAQALCASNVGGATERFAGKIKQCQTRAVSEAVQQIDTPELTAAAQAAK